MQYSNTGEEYQEVRGKHRFFYGSMAGVMGAQSVTTALSVQTVRIEVESDRLDSLPFRFSVELMLLVRARKWFVKAHGPNLI